MSHKKSKNHKQKNDFFSGIFIVLRDILFAYKNFLHWNISKILISLWTFSLGVMLSLPVFLLMLVIGIFDPIVWLDIIAYALSGSTVASIDLISAVAMHPFNLAGMVFLGLIAMFLFLLGSGYSLFLHAQLALGYVKEKRLPYKKNSYFHRGYIFKFMGVILWCMVYLLAPLIIWVGLIFFVYLFYNAGFLSFDGLSWGVGIITFFIVLWELYLLYRVMFGYIILADDSKKKHLQSARYYVQESIRLTKGWLCAKFAILYILFVMLIAPSTILDNYLEQRGGIMRDAVIYNSGLLQDLQPEQIQYYEYISEEYNDMTNEEISSALRSLTVLRFILYIATYLLITGVFTLGATSFYKRVLVKK